MKIMIALIRSEHIAEVHELSAKLQEAMETGEVRFVDQATEKLLSLSDKDHSVSISEEFWHQLILSIRNIDKSFKSDYVITKPQLEMIVSAGLGKPYTGIVNVMKQALELESNVLQLPYEEENVNV
jgi:hypothetical protein